MPEIEPKNLSAQLAYRGVGNPPASHPHSAISNCFPGLEFDFRGVWKHILVSVELHESDNFVVRVEPGGVADQAGIVARDFLVSVDGNLVETSVQGPRIPNGPTVDLSNAANLEWTNSLADVMAKQGEEVACVFRRRSNGQQVTVNMIIRPLFVGTTLVESYPDGEFKGTVAEPGALTQGLCSPWQADYRECGCYYWAASRPDFVNHPSGGGDIEGDNWMRRQRGPVGQKQYEFDQPAHENPANPPSQWTYEELYRDWERLRFLRKGQDE